MRRYNKGTIFTNNNCIACNKCIAECNILGANIPVNTNDKTQICINSSKCLECGLCLRSCPHNAREFKDDTEAFFKALSEGEKITVIFSNTFNTFYDEKIASVIGYLRSIGVNKIYNCDAGETISVWAHTKYIKDIAPKTDKPAFIANHCAAITHRIEKFYPSLVDKLIPVQSPAICEAIYLHKYLKNDDKIAFIGPCIAKTQEFKTPGTDSNINYLLTYNHFMKKLEDVDLSSYNSQLDELDIKATSSSTIYGSFRNKIAKNFPNGSRIIYMESKLKDNFDIISIYENLKDKEFVPLMIDFLACTHACNSGPGIETDKLSFENIITHYYKNATNVNCDTDYNENWQNLQKELKKLKYEDFTRQFDNLYLQSVTIPESTYEDVFNSMRKMTPEKRNINCSSCGYKTCKDMATAIAYGFNKKENCIHYMNEQFFYNFYTDKETGIPNKISFVNIMKKLLENNPEKGYIIISGDVNRLKVINDLYGMPRGDAVLRIIAKKLTEAAGPEGICGRLGGGTFALVFENTPENMKRFRSIKYFDCSEEGIKFPVTMRFGIYIPTDFETNPHIGLNFATLSMDKNVSTTQNTFTLYSESFRKQTKREIEITAKLQPALNNNEFKLWFQPQYKASTGELIGAEALCRWFSNDEIIMPGVFIPISEKSGFIKTLDVEIWRMAFQTLRKWIDAGIKPIPLSVNISRISLLNDSLISTIKHFADEYKIPVNLIHFEVTESAYMEDQQNMIDRINSIRRLGYQIAMDDFGSGYSSLNTLKDLPIDILKLDMGFIRDKTNMDKGGKILTSLTHMAQNLEYTTIAEGVETQEQADFLKSIGIDIIQGFLYSKPIPEEKLVELISSTENSINIEKSKSTGLVDMGNFYNPESSESIMFDKLSGPAAIIEYLPKQKKTSILRINQKCLRVFGAESLSFKEIQKSYYSFFSKETRQKLLSSIQKTIETGSEVIFTAQDKELINENIVWTKFHIWEISSKDESHIIYVLIEDITDEKNIETSLELANAHLASMIDNSKIGMCLMNVRLDLLNFMDTIKIHVLKVNKELVELSGYSEDEILAWTEKEALGVIHPVDRPGFIIHVVKAFTKKNSEPFTQVFRALCKDGEYRRTKMHLNVIRQDDGSYMLFTNYTAID
jgi:EAL domain-containing protein (putative c-di-GMP-specific phosphodiesterase class I)/GGDEF domain-containing protein/PAS domain-containing protein/NAD-dependent dihydropyrimidine dehydrogenase PreA subunit